MWAWVHVSGPTCCQHVGHACFYIFARTAVTATCRQSSLPVVASAASPRWTSATMQRHGSRMRPSLPVMCVLCTCGVCISTCILAVTSCWCCWRASCLAVGELQCHHRCPREAVKHRIFCGDNGARVVFAAPPARGRRARVRIVDRTCGGAVEERAGGVLGLQACPGEGAGPAVRRPRATHQQRQQGAGAGAGGEHQCAHHTLDWLRCLPLLAQYAQ